MSRMPYARTLKASTVSGTPPISNIRDAILQRK